MDKLHYYLNTGLKVQIKSEYKDYGTQELTIGNLELCDGKTYKPLMRPLSSLTKPITVEGYNDGKPFVPIEELCRTFYGHRKTKYMISENNVFILCEHRNGESIYVHKDSILIDFGIMEKLFKWHIWPFDQSEFGKSLIEIKE